MPFFGDVLGLTDLDNVEPLRGNSPQSVSIELSNRINATFKLIRWKTSASPVYEETSPANDQRGNQGGEDAGDHPGGDLGFHNISININDHINININMLPEMMPEITPMATLVFTTSASVSMFTLT